MTASPHRSAVAPAAAEILRLLAQADALSHEDPQRAGALYAQVRDADPANLHAHNAIERLGFRGNYARWMGVNCTIHPDDDIFRFFAGYPGCLNPVRDYLADGWRTLAELMVVLERARRPLLDMRKVLEFAAGFGRFTRHLAPLLPGRLHCADVLPGSVEFLGETFGVETFASAHEPENVAFPARYDLVFVLSLFTHLPLHVWSDWLKALYGAVAPGGLLVFSVHNETAGRAVGVDFGDEEVRFIPSSESPSLEGTTYGTTFTLRRVVEREVEAALGKPVDAYQEAAFWAGQDAVVVAR